MLNFIRGFLIFSKYKHKFNFTEGYRKLASYGT